MEVTAPYGILCMNEYKEGGERREGQHADSDRKVVGLGCM
jgi:hypothetical protein